MGTFLISRQMPSNFLRGGHEMRSVPISLALRQGVARALRAPTVIVPHQLPVFGMLCHGSRGGSDSPFCSSSMEMPSGVRMNAM